MYLSSASPRGGGGPRADVGEYRTLWGLCNKFLPMRWGKCGDFASVQLRVDWERSIVRSIDGKMAEEKYRTAHKLLRIEQKVDFFFKKYSQKC